VHVQTDRSGHFQGGGNQRLRLALFALLIAGSVVFLWRGPVRGAFAGHHDFALVYGSARAWLVGLDPYTADAVREAWAAARGTPGRDPMGERESNVLLYPPGAFVVLAPVAALPWPVASAVWALGNTVLFFAAIWMVGALAWPRRDPGDAHRPGLLIFFAIAVWFAPAATNAAMGQTAMLSMVLIAAAQVARARGRAAGQEAPSRRGGALTGILLGASTALKPQMALLFVVYEAGRLRWKSVAWAVAAVVVLMAVGGLRMQAAGVDWYGSWRANLAAFTAVADGDPTRENPIRYQMVNLQYPLHNFTDDRVLVRVLTFGALGLLSLAYFAADLKRGRERGEGHGELLSLSMTAVVTLLIVYHRFYDAVLLLFPLALAIRVLSARGEAGESRRAMVWRRGHIVTLLMVSPFFVPGAVVLVRAAEAGFVPEWLWRSRLWEHLILPHQPLALLLLCGWLVLLRWTSWGGGAPAPIPPEATVTR
jgi:hypothetical protein